MARMQGKTTFGAAEHFAGIDVSQVHLDLALWPGVGRDERGKRLGRTTRFANDAAGIAGLVATLKDRHLVVLEPTGRYTQHNQRLACLGFPSI